MSSNIYNISEHLVYEYLSYHDEYSKIYGPKTCILMQVGDFYEMYQLEYNLFDNNGQRLSKGPDLTGISNTTHIIKTIQNKNKNLYLNLYRMGFNNLVLHEYMKILAENNYTCVLIDRVTTFPEIKRDVVGIYSKSIGNI